MRVIKQFGMPIVILCIVVLVVLSFINVNPFFQSQPLLLSILTTLFCGILPFFILFLAGKAFLKGNNDCAGLVCCGVLVFGLGVCISTWILFVSRDANLAITIQDICILGSALLHFLAALSKNNGKIRTVSQRRGRIIGSIIGSCAFVALVIIGAVSKILPPLFDRDRPTFLLQIIMWNSVVYFFTASMLSMKQFFLHKDVQLFWYFQSLIFLSISMAAFICQKNLGDSFGWIGRISMYIGSLFLGFSFSIARSKSKGTAFTNILVDFFADPELSYRSLVETAGDAILSVDENFRIFFMNSAAEEMFGYKRNELKNESFLDLLICGEFKELLRDDFNAYAITGESRLTGTRTEVELKAKDGRIIPIELSVAIRRLSTAIVITYILRDITLRKQTEEDLKKKAEELALKNKLITEFFTNISHEFKTPLSIILIQLELMKLSLDDEEKMQELIAAATQTSYRLARLIGNLLDITKIEAGFVNVHYESVEIIQLLKDICDSVVDYAGDKCIQLNFDPLLQVKVMPVDVEKIERILLNLLSNAIKNTEENGKIKVTVDEGSDGSVLISVEDTGIGIPQDKLETIFDRFAQVDTSFNRINEGCGIGLALVKSLVDMLEGKITVQSELNQGSKFSIELPLIDLSALSKINKTSGFNLAKKIEIELSDIY